MAGSDRPTTSNGKRPGGAPRSGNRAPNRSGDRKPLAKGPKGKPSGKPSGKHAGKGPRDRDQPPRPATTARGTAQRMLNAVTQEGRLLAECEHMMTPLDPADRARAQRLVTETLRHMDRADALLTRHMSHAAPPPVQTILRIATYELASGEASHGVVNTAGPAKTRCH